MLANTCETGYYQREKKYQVSERMLRRGNPHALLVGMQTGAATAANGREVAPKIKNGATV